MPHTPGNELLASAMPKTGQKENDQRVGFCAKDLLLPAFELQWIEDVIAEPGAQGNMPATPKIGNVEGKVREIEVLRQVKPEHLPQANRHIGVT